MRELGWRENEREREEGESKRAITTRNKQTNKQTNKQHMYE
jgi:hypothetical protein